VARIGDDGLRRLDLAVVEIEQGAVLVDRRRADHGVVDLELLDEVVRLLADHRTVGAAHRAAGHDDLDARMRVEQHRDVEVVGDDQKALVRGERAGDFLGRGADVDEQRAAVGDQCRRGGTDRRFSAAATKRRAA